MADVTITLTHDEAEFVLNELRSQGHGHGSSKEDFEPECPSCTAADKLKAALAPGVAACRPAADKITIRYERAGRCFWHIGCTAQHHAPPMRIGQDDAEKRRTAIHCTACNEAGYYPHGSVGEVCCERVTNGVTTPLEGRDG